MSSWGVWKNPQSALAAKGDVDTLAAESEWPIVVGEYRSWAREQHLGPVVACTHVPDLLVLAACDGGQLLQMDVYSRHVFRGAPFATADDARTLLELDERGFRRLRPGAEAVWLLLAGGVRLGGRPSASGLAAIATLVCDDPEGTEAATRLIRRRGRHVLAAANALAAGGWDRRALILFELDSVRRLVRDPSELANCVRRDFRRLRPCALVEALEAGRRVPGDRDAWIAQLTKSHAVYETEDKS